MTRSIFAAALVLAGTQGAFAQPSTPPALSTGTPSEAPVAAPTANAPSEQGWSNSVKLLFQTEAGIVGNTASPDNGANFGHLMTDKANRPVLNQILFGAIREIDPKATGYDFGFKFQAMYGSDARITHTLGVFDQMIHNRNQLDIVEANVTLRLPVFAEGLDLKAGIYPTPLGFETIDPKTNAFYTKSYIFNFGLPFKHLGALATAHVGNGFDVYLGIDTGTNTGLAYGAGDNNNRPGGVFGVGWTGGPFTVVALTHIGPENSRRVVPFANDKLRYYNDVVFTWKANDKLTLTTEGNYVKDDGFRAEGYGAAQYAAYKINDQWTLNGRAEVWRDNSNFFVSSPVAERDYSNAQRGSFARLYTSPRATTYSGFTAGVTYQPAGLLPERFSTFMLRPEVRYDRTLNGVRPYNGGRDAGQFTIAGDVIVGF